MFNVENFVTIVGIGAQVIGKEVVHNLPVIQTAFNIFGTIATPIITGKSVLVAKDIIDKEKEKRNGAPISKGETVELVWPHFILPTFLCALTCASEIKTTNDLLTKAASATALAAATNKALDEFKAKTSEQEGCGKVRKITDSIAQDEVNAISAANNGNPPIFIGTGKVLCLDGFSGRTFQATMEGIRRAVNDVNEILYSTTRDSSTGFIACNEVQLNDFWSAIDDRENLGVLESGYNLGWDTQHPIRVEYTTCLYSDNVPCIKITYDLYDLATMTKVMSA